MNAVYIKRAVTAIFTAAALSAAVYITASAYFSARRIGGDGADILRCAIERAAVSCYATEGVYPPTLDYLCENYGVSVDISRYAVDYDCFASNIMPSVIVSGVG
ncbi:MAG: hypothetical protein WCQ72_03485 [Eubacteriales bacterium]